MKGSVFVMSEDALSNYGRKWEGVRLVEVHRATKYMPAKEFFARGSPEGYHPGYDEGAGGSLYDLVREDTGEPLGMSLYSWELVPVKRNPTNRRMRKNPIKLKRIGVSLMNTPLKKAVGRWLNDSADYDDGAKGRLKDLMHGGGQSGIISELTYTRDCVKFYKRHQREIDELLKNICDDTGSSPSELFARSNWDASDPLAREDNNLNILAWFGFEETARNLGNEMGWDV